MRRSGGYVDWRQRSRWKIRQVKVAVTWFLLCQLPFLLRAKKYLQSCILGVFIDCIWNFGNFSQIFSRFYWLQLEFLYLQSNIFQNCMTAFELFKICGQLGTLFLMTYLEILQYAVNLSLYTEVLHCTILKSITFPPPLFNFIIFPGKNAPQYMGSPR